MWIPRSKHDLLRRLSLKRMVSRHEVAEIGPAIAVTVFLARMIFATACMIGDVCYHDIFNRFEAPKHNAPVGEAAGAHVTGPLSKGNSIER